MFTTVLIILASVALVTIVVHEIWAWRRPGHHISQQAPTDNGQSNLGRLTHETNVHGGSSSGGTPRSM